jgi:acyl-coenzyme A synthetase/AMP-(fatty) acid ligase
MAFPATSGFRDTVTDASRKAMYRSRGLWTTATLATRVGEKARADGQMIAVVDNQGSRKRTYAQLNRDVLVLRKYLKDHGVSRGQVVSVQLPNRYEAVVAAVTAQSLGAVLNPLLPNYRAHELEHVFSTARPTVIFTPGNYRDCDYVDMISSVVARTDAATLHIVVDDARSGGDAQLLEILERGDVSDEEWVTSDAEASDVSEVIFTSGTESTPKAVMHTEETTNFAARVVFEDLGVVPDQVVWMPSPVGHSTGLNYGTRTALVNGRTLVLQDRWNASDAIELIRQNKCSYTLAATTFLQGVVEECERTQTRLPEMSHFGCGGAPVPAELVDRAKDVGIIALRLYGSTEALCATWNRPDSPTEKRRTTDGPALSHTDIAIRDEDGVEVDQPGEGELHVRGPNTSIGYYNDPERTAATYLEGGWIRSGDLVSIDSDGYVTVVGRKKEIIIRGGLNIAPREIEDMLMSFPEIERAAVVGVPNERLGEKSCACVVLRPGAAMDLATMTGRLREAGLAIYKLPEDLRVMESLPSTASGKIQKHEILRLIKLEHQESVPAGVEGDRS